MNTVAKRLATRSSSAEVVQKSAETMGSLSTNPRPVLLFLDFDGTITRKDTLHLVAKVGYVQHHQSSDKRTAARLPPWEYFGDSYMKDYRQHEQQYQPRKEHRCSVQQEIAWLRSLRAVEEASIRRAIDSGLFDVANPLPAIDRVLQEDKQSITMRAGLAQLLSDTRARNFSGIEYLQGKLHPTTETSYTFCHILSVNWSKLWIASVMKDIITIQDSLPSSGGVDDGEVQIFANEVFNKTSQDASAQFNRADTFSEAAQTRHDHNICCTTSEDKVVQMQRVMAHYQSVFSPDTSERRIPISLHVGDSATDLECLLEADIGVGIRDEPMGSGQKELAETCQRIGVAQHHISEASLAQQSLLNHLWWARDFSEISKWLQDSTASSLSHTSRSLVGDQA